MNEEKGVANTPVDNNIVHDQSAINPKDEIDLIAMYADLWADKKIIIISILIFFAVGLIIVFKDKNMPPLYSGHAVVKVAQYLADSNVQTIADIEELTYRFKNLDLIRTKLDRRRPVEGLVNITVRGSESHVKVVGEKTLSDLLTYLESLEKQMEKHGISLISGTEILVPLSVSVVQVKDRSSVVLSSMAVLGLIIGIVVMLIKQALGSRRK